MIKLKSAVIVEGKYDKITLENIIDAPIITTEGFGIFNDKDKRKLIRRIAEKDGIIVMTDSDSAGALIRAHIKNIAAGCKITNVYIPCLKGKERRKAARSKEGLLGVEGMNTEIISECLRRSGVTDLITTSDIKRITKTDMFKAGLSGSAEASLKRRSFLRYIDLPEKLSSNAMLDILNTLFSYDEFYNIISAWQKKEER